MHRLPPRKPLMPIDRWAGVATQFERVQGGYLFRRHGRGPAVFASPAERDAFAAAGMRALLLHAAAFVMTAGAAWLLIGLSGWGETPAAIAFGVVASLIAMAMFAAQRWHADAPGRALIHRTVVLAAREPAVSERQSYGAIAGTTLALLALAGIGTGRPPGFYIAFATGAVMLGLFVAGRRWLTDARRPNAQRRRAEQGAAPAPSGSQVVLLLLFVAIEIILLLGAMVAGVVGAAAIVGQPSEELSFGLFMTGFLGGLMLGALLVVPLDQLCRRLTGASAGDTLGGLPPGW